MVDAANTANTEVLAKDTTLGLLVGSLEKVKPIADRAATGRFKVLLNTKAVDDLWIVVNWSSE